MKFDVTRADSHLDTIVKIGFKVSLVILHEITLGLAGVQGDLGSAGLHQVDKPGSVLIFLVILGIQTVVTEEMVSPSTRYSRWTGPKLCT